MINLPDFDSQRTILNQPIDAELREPLRQCLELAYANGVADLTHILVLEPGDTEADIVEAIGFSPLLSRIDGIPGQLDADLIAEHADWWQLTYCVGNSGFAYILFASKAYGILPELQVMCQRRCSG